MAQFVAYLVTCNEELISLTEYIKLEWQDL